MKKLLLLLSFCFLFVISGRAEEITVKFASDSYENASDLTSVVLNDYVSATAEGGSKFYVTDATWRVYSGKKLTINVSEGYEISKIVITHTGSKYAKFSYAGTDGNITTSSAIQTFVASSSGLSSVSLSATATTRVNAITVTYKVAAPASQVATPTITPADGSKVEYGSTVTVSSIAGTNLVVSYGDVTAEQVEGNTTTITLPDENSGITEYIVEAYAVDPSGALSDSEVAKATYTLYSSKVANIAAFLKAADTEKAKVFQNPVTAIYQNGSNLYVKDGSGYLLIYGNVGQTYNNGDVIPAGFSGTYFLYNNLPELKNPSDFLASTENTGEVTPTDATIEHVSDCSLSEYISLKKVKYDGKNLTDGTNSIAATTTGVTLTSGKTYNVKAFVDVEKVKVVEAEELQYVSDLKISPAFGNIEIGKTITISCETAGATLDGYLTIGDTETELKDVEMPYEYIVKEEDFEKTISVSAQASLAGYESSSVLEGSYTVVAPTPAAPVFSIEGGEVGNKTEVTISAETGSTLSLYLGEGIDPVASTNEGSISYTISGSAGEIIVLTAKVLNKYGKESSATYTFSILNPKASKTATWRFVGASSGTLTNDANSASGVWTAKQTDGTLYCSKTSNNGVSVVQLGSSNNPFKGTLTLSNSDLKNISFIQSITVTAISFKGIKTTVTAVIGETESYPQDVAYATGTIDYANIPSITFSPIDIQSDKVSFNISSTGGTLIKAITIVYRDDEHPFSDEATYTKLEAGKSVEEGNFVVLSYNNIAVSRANASQGAAVTLSEDGDIVLEEGQNSIDEFEVVLSGTTFNGKSGFYLYGGVDNGVEKNRHYLGTPAFVTDEIEAAEFYVDDEALLRYADGDYLAYVGGAFVKSADCAGAVTLYVNDSGVTTDVEAVEIEDADAPVEYYNLQGVRVANPQNGLYIVRQGNKVSKQIIR